jgi:predicted transcriptional regulator
MTIIRNLHLDKLGLEMFVGTLEAAILRVLWEENRPLKSNDVHRYLMQQGYTQEFNTVDTTMRRMLEPRKNLLVSKDEKARRYTPIVATEDEFIVTCIDDVINALQNSYADLTIAFCGINGEYANETKTSVSTPE